MPLGQYIFDADVETPEELRRKRALAEALLQNASGGVATTFGGGLAQLGQALAGRLAMSRANAADKKVRQGAQALWQQYIADQTAGGSPVANPANDSTPPDLAAGIKETADSLGISPSDLATVISYETGGTFDPTKAGPTTKWGQHKGLIQFGEPQAKQYGVDWSTPVSSQLGKGKAIARYLADAGVQPGMGLKDIYSAVNAGKVGRYNASDEAAGGAPGTVMDKVTQQMGPHRAKALALLQANGAPSGPVPASVPGMLSGMPIPGATGLGAAAAVPALISQAAPAVQNAMQQQTVVPTSGPPPAQGPLSAYQRTLLTSMNKEGGTETPIERTRLAAAGISPSGGNIGGQGGFLGTLGLGGAAPGNPPPMTPLAVAQANPNTPLGRYAAYIGSPYFEHLSPTAQNFILDAYKQEQARMNPDPMQAIELETKRINLERAKADLASETDPLKRRMLEAQVQKAEAEASTAGQPKLPTSIEEYQYGLENPEYARWQEAMKKAGASSQHVTFPGETQYAKERATSFAKKADEIAATGMAARDQLNSMDVMEGAMKDPNFYSGFGADFVTLAKKFTAAIGGDQDAVSSIETFAAENKKAALASMGGSLGTGFSNADRDFVIEQQPNLLATPAGNAKMIEINRRIARRKLQFADMAIAYESEHGRLDVGFEKMLADYAKANPLFEDMKEGTWQNPFGDVPFGSANQQGKGNRLPTLKQQYGLE